MSEANGVRDGSESSRTPLPQWKINVRQSAAKAGWNVGAASRVPFFQEKNIMITRLTTKVAMS